MPKRSRGFDVSALGPSAQRQLREQGLTDDKRVPRAPREHKFNVSAREQRTVDDIVFDSKWEAEVYKIFKLAIPSDRMELQPKFELQPGFRDSSGTKHRAINYTADFRITSVDGQVMVVDAKGMETPEFKMKLKLFIYRYKLPIYRLKSKKDVATFLDLAGY